MQTRRSCLSLLALTVAAAPAHAAEKSICVSVTVRQPSEAGGEMPAASPDNERPGARPPPRKTAAGTALPLGQDPVSYLKRLIEYFVTHEHGFVAVQSGCQEHLDVELYPLQDGWTAFARYSGTGREERVDYLFTDELSQFAERAALALLYDKPISTTILRDTVLRADSKRATQRIRGSNHFLLGLGTELRGGIFPTVQKDGSAADQVRVFGPITFGLGYRGKFESWGVEAIGGLSIGTSKTGLQQNSAGGHVDYGGNVSVALHFLRYLNPRGLTSFFIGAGGSFEVLWFYQINGPMDRQYGNTRSTPASGGFDVDLIGGVEFMRASKVQFLLQGALLVPAYVVENGDGVRNIKTWFPGASVGLGMLF